STGGDSRFAPWRFSFILRNRAMRTITIPIPPGGKTPMSDFVTLLQSISNVLWGWPALILIAGTGLYLTARLTFLPLRRLGFGFRQIFNPATGEGTIGAGAALATSLSATIGTGNIVGVATAIHAGGPGALVWMWLIALIGMA